MRAAGAVGCIKATHGSHRRSAGRTQPQASSRPSSLPNTIPNANLRLGGRPGRYRNRNEQLRAQMKHKE